MMRKLRLLLIASVTTAAIAAWAIHMRLEAGAERSLASRVSARVPAALQAQTACAEVARRQPVVLLVLGQSNAGSHGVPDVSQGEPVTVMTDRQGCFSSSDPLPGGTGGGGSIWTRLPAALKAVGVSRPVVIGLLAVDGTSMREWTSSKSPLPALLQATARNMVDNGLKPDLVLWQQGEADARARTGPADYVAGLQTLQTRLNSVGVSATWVLAKSTVCRSVAASSLRDELDKLVAHDNHFAIGPDTDALTGGAFRVDGCHLTRVGLQEAAAAWAVAVAKNIR